MAFAVRCFKTKKFAKWAREEGIKDSELQNAAQSVFAGQSRIRLRENLYKIRMAKSSMGKRGGFRVIIAYQAGRRLFFLYGFDKSDMENISKKEENDLEKYANIFLNYTNDDLEIAVESKALEILTE